MFLCAKIGVVLCVVLISLCSFAEEKASVKMDVYSTPEYIRLSESFSNACKQNEFLRKEVSVLQQVKVHAELKPEDQVKIDRLLKTNSMIALVSKIAAGFFAVLSCILFLIIIGLASCKNKWKAKTMQLEQKRVQTK